MNTDSDLLEPLGLPVYIDKARELSSHLSSLPYEQLKKLLGCNDEIAQLNYQRYQQMQLEKAWTPAILAYDGIQYKYMAPQVFEEEYFQYVQQHLRILSGLYGILKPFDAVVPYRLEMQAKLKTDFCSGLYDFWKSDIYDELTRDDSVILNLASHEYSKVVLNYCKPEVTCITCIFGELESDKIREKGVYVKMARGQMVRYMAENKIEKPEEVRGFCGLGFRYSEIHSAEDRYVFIKE